MDRQTLINTFKGGLTYGSGYETVELLLDKKSHSRFGATYSSRLLAPQFFHSLSLECRLFYSAWNKPRKVHLISQQVILSSQ